MTVKLAVAGAFHTQYMKPAEDSLRCASLSSAPCTSQQCARHKRRCLRCPKSHGCLQLCLKLSMALHVLLLSMYSSCFRLVIHSLP